MLRRTSICTLAFLVAAPLSARAQPAVVADSPYRIALRNAAPFEPGPGAELALPGSDADNSSVHALVQLDNDEVERARTDAEAEARLRRLLTAPEGAPLRVLRNVQRATYEAVIRRDLAMSMSTDRNLDGLTFVDRDAATLVRWVGSVPREAKLEAALLNGQYPAWGLGPNDTFNLLVTFYEDAVGGADAFLGGVAVDRQPYTADTWRVVLARDRLENLVAEDSVRFVAMGPKPFTPLSDLTRLAVKVEAVQKAVVTTNPPTDTGPTYQGLTGAGITVAVMDDGVNPDHDDFWEHAGGVLVPRVMHHTTTTPLTPHGTLIAGIIAGSGYQSTLGSNGGTVNYQWRGMAPHAKILSFANVDSGGHVATQYQATVLGGADISNDSHEQRGCLDYDAIAETVDRLVRGTQVEPMTGTTIPRRAAIWGAGNNGQVPNRPDTCQNRGYFGLTVAAKNPIVVGATYHDADRLWYGSSLGPTYDGRLKPDVVAPGCSLPAASVGITSAAMLDGYGRLCGTSMATAVVSGIAALLLEKWRQELESTGACPMTSDGECYPLPSTLKALLIQGAKDLELVLPNPNAFLNPDTGAQVEYHAGPDYATGYGLVDAAASVAIIDAGVVGPGRRVLERKAFASVAPDEHLIVVPPNAPRLRVTLAWDDPEGHAWKGLTDPQLVNDLDLELVGPPPNNTVVLPWTLPALPPNASAAQDPYQQDPVAPSLGPANRMHVDERNNVEQVEVPPSLLAEGGTWRIRVKSGKLLPGTSQEYSLVSDYAFVSSLGAVEPPPPVGPPGSETPCRELDWDRAAPGAFAFDFEGGRCGFIPLEPICRYVVSCTVCDRFGVCPALRVSLTGVAEFFRVAVRRRDGTSVAVDDSRRQAKTLSWQPLAGEEYGLFFDVVGNDRRAERLTIGIEVSTQRAAGDPR